jgi:trimethylamine--corrinoid protein Co-methyltransferase
MGANMKLTNWQVLSEKEIIAINDASLDILENTGLLIESEAVRNLLAENGAVIDNERVKFPRPLVEDCINLNKPTIQMTDRNGKDAYLIGDGNVRFAGGHNAVFVPKDKQEMRQNSSLKDVESFAVICEQLEDIDMVGVPLNPFDAPAKTMLAHAVTAILKNSTKPIFFSSESREVNRAIIKLAKETTGFDNFKERSSMISQLSTTSPLYWEGGAAEAIIECALVGMPLAWLPQPIAGMTAPYTIAGNVTVHNTEVLSSMVIAHLVNPGTPQIYAAAWTSYDMRYSNVIIARPAEALMRIAGAQMAHFYNMPSHSIGPDADANVADEQLGWEKMMTLLAAASGGNDLIVNSGMYGTGMSISNEQLLLDNEMNRFAKRMMKGVEVSEETIAKDVIAEVGPRGDYLATDHTLDHLRTGEHIEPTVITGMNYENWKNAGAKNCTELASEQVITFLQNTNSGSITVEKSQKLDSILLEFDQELGES